MCMSTCWKPRWPPVVTPPIVNAELGGPGHVHLHRDDRQVADRDLDVCLLLRLRSGHLVRGLRDDAADPLPGLRARRHPHRERHAFGAAPARASVTLRERDPGAGARRLAVGEVDGAGRAAGRRVGGEELHRPGRRAGVRDDHARPAAPRPAAASRRSSRASGCRPRAGRRRALFAAAVASGASTRASRRMAARRRMNGRWYG